MLENTLHEQTEAKDEREMKKQREKKLWKMDWIAQEN